MAHTPTPAEQALRQALQQSNRSHLGRMFSPVIPVQPRIPVNQPKEK